MSDSISTYDPARDPRSPFKDTQGRLRTRSLFYESQTAGYPAFFTLKDYDVEDSGNTYVSLKRIYLDAADPTEYTFAQRAFGKEGGWQHWQRLKTLKWFSPFYSEWREELETKLQSAGITALKEGAAGKAVSVPAARFFAEKGWRPPNKRGRPSKEEVDGIKKRMASISTETEEDAARLGL